MSIKNTPSLFSKIMAAHAAVVLGVVIFTGVAFYVFSSYYLETEARSEMDRASRLADNIVRRNLLDAALISRLISNSYSIKTALSADGGGPAEEELAEQLETLGADFISVAGRDGVVAGYASRMDFDNADAELAAGEPLFLYPSFQEAESSNTGASGIESVYPGRIAAVAVAPVFSGECSPAATGDGKKGECAGGQRGAHGPAGYVRIGHYLDERFVGNISSLTGMETAIEHRGGIISSTFEMDGETRVSPYIQLEDDYIIGRIPIKNRQRIVANLITIYPRAKIAGVQRNGLIAIAIIAMAAFALSVLASATMSRRIVEPLNTLAEGVSRIETGDFSYRIPERSGDELGRLAESFNRMGRALEKRDEEIRLNQEQLIESGKLAAIGELAAGVAHEIGNPLAAISGYLQLLGSAPEEKRRHYIEELEKEAGFIDSTIRDLLDFSRPGSGGKDLVDVEAAVMEALRILSFHKIMKYVDVETCGLKDMPRIYVSRKELIQAVLNISLNAAQAMKGRGIIDISCEAQNENVILKIADTGPGIPPEDLSRVFEPFYTTKRTGTGLGLSITYRIVKNNAGRIDVDSRPGEGTAFFLTFPRGSE